jgi:hypothetical protein
MRLMSNEPTQPADEIQEQPGALDTEDERSDTVDGAAIDADIAAIRALWERILPDADCRITVANVLTDVIRLAHQIGPNRWATTVGNQRHIRLNVGNYVVAEVGKNYLWLAVDSSILDPSSLPRLQQLHRWNSYTKFPNEMGGYIRCHELNEVLLLMHEAAEAFVLSCAQQVTRIRSTVSDAHAASVVAYLREITGRGLPDPEYGPDTPQQDSLARVDRAAIEAAFDVFDRERRTTSYWESWEHDPTYRYVVMWQGQRYPIKEIVRIASGAPHFNSSVARRLLSRLGFPIETLHDTAQHVWLFQANPRYYDLAERLVSASANAADEWTVTRYRDEMRPGDPVVLWLAGPQAGIYALGELTGAPVEYTYASDEIPKWITPNPAGPTTVWRVPFRYTHILPEPLRKPTFQEHAVLQHMMVLRVPNNTNFKVTREEWEAIQTLLDRVPSKSPPAAQNPEYPLSQCATETGIDEIELSRWLRAIERKGQSVLYGPPGTGKTFVAQHLARHLIGGGNGFVELVQFHPAYSYEDFIQGIRPQSLADGTLTYPLVPGRFLDFCARAKAITDTCVLIIDEINRANLARVFGELMYLLEYRDQSLPLAGGGLLSIPPNVRLIGTMNTADRSIALVDHTLRRRFAFLPLQPNYTVLRRFQEQHGFDANGLVTVLEQINRDIGDANYAVGISFFMRMHLDQELEDLWRMEIEPYLEEYFFDRREVFERFRWAHIAVRVQP